MGKLLKTGIQCMFDGMKAKDGLLFSQAAMQQSTSIPHDDGFLPILNTVCQKLKMDRITTDLVTRCEFN